MRRYIKSLIITAASFYLMLIAVPTLIIGSDPKNTAILIAGLWIISHIINPLFSLIFLPLNILTFGFISLLLNASFIFALIYFLPGFKVEPYTFPGANIDGVIIPEMFLNQILTIILIAFGITIISKILHIIFE